MNFFAHYATNDEPPLEDFYNSILRIGQNHLEKVVRVKAAATYQTTVADVEALTDMVLQDMAKQIYSNLANKHTLDWLFDEAHLQLDGFMREWREVYRHSLIQALKDEEGDREETPPCLDPLINENLGYIKLYAYKTVQAYRESVARDITDPLLDGDEISRTRERIRLDHATEIEEARQQTRAQISSEKKAWAVAFQDSNKLEFLRKAAEEMGVVADPVMPTMGPRELGNSQTPKARKNKAKSKGKKTGVLGLRARADSVSASDHSEMETDVSPHPLIFDLLPSPPLFRGTPPHILTSERSQSQADTPVRNPRFASRFMSEPATDVSVHAGEVASNVPEPAYGSGVAASMHNPANVMEVDTVDVPSQAAAPPPDPNQGLASMLAALQNNLMTAFTAQVASLTRRIDDQDTLIKMLKQGMEGGKGIDSDAIPIPDPLPIPTPDTTPAPVTDPTPVPVLAPQRQAQLAGPKALLPQQGKWAAVVTARGVRSNTNARNMARTNANAIGRTAMGSVQKGKTAQAPPSMINTEITVVRGSGVKDKKVEESLYKSNPAGIVQAVRGQMERMSSGAPPLLYRRWSVNPNSHNFVYVFAGMIPFQLIHQFQKALVDPLGCGNILPNRGWTFAQLRGVPTSDGEGVIHMPDTLLRKIRRVPVFTNVIFCSPPHWQLSLEALAHTHEGAVQLSFIDEDGSISAACKAVVWACSVVAPPSLIQAANPTSSNVDAVMRLVTPLTLPHANWAKTVSAVISAEVLTQAQTMGSTVRPRHTVQWVNAIVDSSVYFAVAPTMPVHRNAPSGAGPSNGTPEDTEGFTTVQKKRRGKTGAQRKAAKRAREAAASKVSNPVLPPASASITELDPSNPDIIYADNCATISETIDAFHALAGSMSDGSPEDLASTLTELEMGWGGRTDTLDHLFSVQARYAVKHKLPLSIPQTEDAIGRGAAGKEQVAARVLVFRKTWGDSNPFHYVYTQLPINTRFATLCYVSIGTLLNLSEE
ncbi:hypothetical protein BJY52DRAFT_1192325 [Lactarius psammicola]|nr:hypothetical protein BJY52DRAFT_1192325 [Lactarius psammicola]